MAEASAFKLPAVNEDGRVLGAIQFKPFPLTASQDSQLQNSHILVYQGRGGGKRSNSYVPAMANIIPMPVTESLCCNWETNYGCSLPTGNTMEVCVKHGELSSSESLPQKKQQAVESHENCLHWPDSDILLNTTCRLCCQSGLLHLFLCLLFCCIIAVLLGMKC